MYRVRNSTWYLEKAMSFFSLKGVNVNFHTVSVLRHKLGAGGINDTYVFVGSIIGKEP